MSARARVCMWLGRIPPSHTEINREGKGIYINHTNIQGVPQEVQSETVRDVFRNRKRVELRNAFVSAVVGIQNVTLPLRGQRSF